MSTERPQDGDFAERVEKLAGEYGQLGGRIKAARLHQDVRPLRDAQFRVYRQMVDLTSSEILKSSDGVEAGDVVRTSLEGMTIGAGFSTEDKLNFAGSVIENLMGKVAARLNSSSEDAPKS